METPKGKIDFGIEDPFKKSPSVLDDLKRIVDVFSGADGGVSYVKLQAFVVRMEEQSQSTAGQQKIEAEILLDVVSKFRKLIDAVCKSSLA